MVFFFGLRPDPLKVAQSLTDKSALKPKTSIATAFKTLKAYPQAAYAVITIALAHMVMVSVMSMTPIHMKGMGFDLVVVGFTISLHIAGMYAFSPVFGWLSDKLGRVQTVILGQLIYVVALGIAGFGQDDRTMVTIGLFLLGLGWSASTVGGAALLTATLPVEEKTNVQGLSDSLMNLSGAFGGAVAGSILTAFMFLGVNLAALIPVFLIVIFAGVTRLRSAR